MCPGNNGGPGGGGGVFPESENIGAIRYPNYPPAEQRRPPGSPRPVFSSLNVDAGVARQQAQLQQQYQPTSSIFETIGQAASGKGFRPTSQNIGDVIGGAMGGTPFSFAMYGARELANFAGNLLAPDLDLTGSRGMTKEARTAAVKRMAGSTTVGNRVQGPGYTVYGTLSLEDTFGYLDKDRGEGGAEQRAKQRTEQRTKQGRSRVKVAASGKTPSVLSPAPDSLGDPRSPGPLPGRLVPRRVSRVNRRSTILSGPQGLLATQNIGKPTLGA
jgi:hypothetical protein